MAFGDPYATIFELEDRLGTADDGTYERILDAASRAVETFTRRQFNQSYAATQRRYRALDRERVAVDDFYTLDDLAVVVDGTAWDVGTYIDARPWDGVREGMIGWPYSDLFAINRCFPWSRRALIAVTAWWGWEQVPSAIVETTLDVAEIMSLSLSNSAGGPIRSETIGGYSVTFALPQFQAGQENVPPELLKALPYRRKIFGVA